MTLLVALAAFWIVGIPALLAAGVALVRLRIRAHERAVEAFAAVQPSSVQTTHLRPRFVPAPHRAGGAS